MRHHQKQLAEAKPTLLSYESSANEIKFHNLSKKT